MNNATENKRRLAYARHDYRKGDPLAILTYPECKIEVIRAGQETQAIVGRRDGDTMRWRISAFIDLARQERAAVLIVCDDDDAQQEIMLKLMRQAMPEVRQVATAAILGKRAA